VGRIFPRAGTTYPRIAWSHRPQLRTCGTSVVDNSSRYCSTLKRTERADDDASSRRRRFQTVSVSLLLTHIASFSPWFCVLQNEPLDEKKKKKKTRIKTTSVAELLLA